LYYLVERSIGQATSALIRAEVRHFIDDRSQELKDWWQAIGEEGQRVYCVLRQAGDWMLLQDVVRAINDPGVAVDDALKALRYHGIVIHDGTYEHFRISGQLFCDWSETRCQPLERPPGQPGGASKLDPTCGIYWNGHFGMRSSTRTGLRGW
jgi:hypothetical protein